jgi:hypothetical protein
MHERKKREAADRDTEGYREQQLSDHEQYEHASSKRPLPQQAMMPTARHHRPSTWG